jgi:hypothetical protein
LSARLEDTSFVPGYTLQGRSKLIDMIESKSCDTCNYRLLNDVRGVIFSAVVGLDDRCINAFSYKCMEGEDEV